MDALLKRLLDENRPHTEEGAVATYIPELGKADPQKLGIAVATAEGALFGAGDRRTPFTIQSIVKIIIFTCGLLDSDPARMLRKVTVEPTSDPFNSIVNLETKNANRPLNPLINAGAIASMAFVAGERADAKVERILDLVRTLSDNPAIAVDGAVYRSEAATGDRNRSLAYFMRSTGVLEGDVEEILDAYFRACSISVTCEDLARIARVYALGGCGHFSPETARLVRTVMGLCGMYDESGDYAVRVGIPSKSGVGGGILAAVPGRMGIGVFGPALNPKGSSVAGIALLEGLSRELGLSIF